MIKIQITKSGIYDQDENPIPVGTVLDVAKEPTGWVNKYKVLANDEGKTLEDATPAGDHEFGNVPLDEVDKHAEADDMHDLRAEYERTFGQAPHHKMKAETIRRKLEEAGDE